MNDWTRVDLDKLGIDSASEISRSQAYEMNIDGSLTGKTIQTSAMTEGQCGFDTYETIEQTKAKWNGNEWTAMLIKHDNKVFFKWTMKNDYISAVKAEGETVTPPTDNLKEAKEKAIATIDSFTYLVLSESSYYKSQIEEASDENEIIRIVKEANAINQQRIDEEAEQSDKEKFENAKADAKSKINGFIKLTIPEKENFYKKIDDCQEIGQIQHIVDEANNLNNSRLVEENLLKQAKEKAIVKINAMAFLSRIEKDDFNRRINNASNESTINAILTEAEKKNKENEIEFNKPVEVLGLGQITLMSKAEWLKGLKDLEHRTESLIEQTKAYIMTQVADTYYDKNNSDKIYQQTVSKITQTANDIVMEFNQYYEQQLSELSDGTDVKFLEISEYIRFSGGEIELGKRGNQYKLRIARQKVAFLDSGAEVAYLSNNKLYVRSAEILESVIVGPFSITRRPNGNFAVKKLGI